MRSHRADFADERLLELLADEAVGELSGADCAELAGRLGGGDGVGEHGRDEMVYVAALLDLSDLRAVEPAPDRVLEGLKAAGAAWVAGRANAGALGQAGGVSARTGSRNGEARLALSHSGRARTSNVSVGTGGRAAPVARRPWVRPGAGWAVAAVLALAWVVWFAVPRAGTNESGRVTLAELASDPKTLVVTWQAGTDSLGRAVTGRVVWNAERQSGYMVFSGLTPNDPSSEQYQLWVFDAERDERFPVHGGVFDVRTTESEVIVPIEPRLAIGDVAAFVVTVERPGGVWVSDRSRIAAIAARGG